MLKKTMTTVDFGGTERTEDYYFNLTEYLSHDASALGGMSFYNFKFFLSEFSWLLKNTVRNRYFSDVVHRRRLDEQINIVFG